LREDEGELARFKVWCPVLYIGCLHWVDRRKERRRVVRLGIEVSGGGGEFE